VDFDDIHWSPDMEEAWNIIKEHSLVTVTIDVFQWELFSLGTTERTFYYQSLNQKMTAISDCHFN
jgi:hypothetical protein